MAVELAAVARVLSQVASSIPRTDRRKGDLEGDFDQWFDGGAIKTVTGWTEYHLTDGAVAVFPTTPNLRVDIRLPAGEFVSISELGKAPPLFPIDSPP